MSSLYAKKKQQRRDKRMSGKIVNLKRAQARKALVPESPFGFIVSVVVCIFIYAFSKKLSDNLLISNSFSIRTTHQQRARIVLRTFKLSFSSFGMMLFFDIAPEHWRRPQHYTDDRATIFELFMYIFLCIWNERFHSPSIYHQRRFLRIIIEGDRFTTPIYLNSIVFLFGAENWELSCDPTHQSILVHGTEHVYAMREFIVCSFFLWCGNEERRRLWTALHSTFSVVISSQKKWTPIGSVVCAFSSDGWRRWMRRKEILKEYRSIFICCFQLCLDLESKTRRFADMTMNP